MDNIKYFIAGFIAGEGHFADDNGNRFYYLSIDLHERDIGMLETIQKVLGGGKIDRYPYRPRMVRYYIGGVDNIKNIVIPFMDKYLIDSYKVEQYKWWKNEFLKRSKQVLKNREERVKRGLLNKQKIVGLRNTGQTFKEIAEVIGLSKQRVHAIYHS